MSQARIRAAFEQRLASWAATQSLPVAWQNAPGNLPTVDHLRAYLLPAETTSRDLAGKSRSYRGLIQVTVFVKSGQGAGKAEQIARKLDELFPTALVMQSGGLAVTVVGPVYVMPSIQESDWYSVPCRCRYGAEEVLTA